jgi:pyruvate dehydrogenase E2 component (dihydrolipoamide acetyltransferase)
VAVEITMPMLGLTMTEGALRKWWKQEGDPVEKGAPLFEVETDKALIDVEAPGDGWLLRVLVRAGQVVPVGTIVGVIGAEKEDISTSVGASVAASAGEASAGPRPVAETPHPAPASRPKPISPRARRLAEEHYIDWKDLQGTGPEGLITEKDVQCSIANPRASSPPAGPRADTVQVLSSTRQIIADRLTQSLHERAHIYLTMAVEMGAALDCCQKPSTDSGGSPGSSPLSVNDLIFKAAATCLTEYPQMNSTLVGKEIHLHPSANIGFAVSAEDGTLVVPVLRGVEALSLVEIAKARRALVEKATHRRITPGEMVGGTFTISNLGTYGVEQFTAIINPPETGILALGAISEEPRVINGGLYVRPMMRVTLGVDHRVVDGAQAAQFLRRFKTLLEQPKLLTVSTKGV